VQLGLNHPFEMTREVTLTPGITGGYYYSVTARLTHYNIMIDPSTGGLDTSFGRSYSGPVRTITMGGVKQVHTPVRKGVSDITPSIALAFTKGPVSLRGGLYWCIVPAKSWYNGAEIHRLYANLGATCSL
jgi:hypothetical protein